jgi:hypothetical protein
MISRDSSVCSAGLRDGWSGVRVPADFGVFLFTTASILALGPTEPPIQWVAGALSLEIKRPEGEADHSPPSSIEVKNVWSYISTPSIRLHGAVLSLKHRDIFKIKVKLVPCLRYVYEVCWATGISCYQFKDFLQLQNWFRKCLRPSLAPGNEFKRLSNVQHCNKGRC